MKVFDKLNSFCFFCFAIILWNTYAQSQSDGVINLPDLKTWYGCSSDIINYIDYSILATNGSETPTTGFGTITQGPTVKSSSNSPQFVTILTDESGLTLYLDPNQPTFLGVGELSCYPDPVTNCTCGGDLPFAGVFCLAVTNASKKTLQFSATFSLDYTWTNSSSTSTNSTTNTNTTNSTTNTTTNTYPTKMVPFTAPNNSVTVHGTAARQLAVTPRMSLSLFSIIFIATLLTQWDNCFV